MSSPFWFMLFLCKYLYEQLLQSAFPVWGNICVRRRGNNEYLARENWIDGDAPGTWLQLLFIMLSAKRMWAWLCRALKVLIWGKGMCGHNISQHKVLGDLWNFLYFAEPLHLSHLLAVVSAKNVHIPVVVSLSSQWSNTGHGCVTFPEVQHNMIMAMWVWAGGEWRPPDKYSLCMDKSRNSQWTYVKDLPGILELATTKRNNKATTKQQKSYQGTEKSWLTDELTNIYFALFKSNHIQLIYSIEMQPGLLG